VNVVLRALAREGRFAITAVATASIASSAASAASAAMPLTALTRTAALDRRTFTWLAADVVFGRTGVMIFVRDGVLRRGVVRELLRAALARLARFTAAATAATPAPPPPAVAAIAFALRRTFARRAFMRRLM
jgi:hypothetical protein